MASSIWIKFSNHVRMQVLSICSLPNMMHSAHIPCISMTLQNVYNRIIVTSGVDMMHLLYENLTHGVHENHICQLNVWYPTRSLRWDAFGYSFRWMGCSNWLTYDLPLCQFLKIVFILFCWWHFMVIHEIGKQVVELVTVLGKPWTQENALMMFKTFWIMSPKCFEILFEAQLWQGTLWLKLKWDRCEVHTNQ